MRIYVVTELLSNGESRAVSAHIDRYRAEQAGVEVSRRHSPGGSVVEPVELDLTGVAEDPEWNVIRAAGRAAGLGR